MRIVVINHFSIKRVDYLKAFEKINAEIIFLTKEKFKNDFKPFFKHTIGYENLDTNDNVYWDIVRLHSENPIDAIVATYEFDLENTGRLRDYLGIFGQKTNSAVQFRNKFEMKSKLKGLIQLPAFQELNSVFDLMSFLKTYDYPIVVKPKSGAGSVGVKILRNEEDTKQFLVIEDKKDLMLEKYVPGDMFHVDGLFMEGTLILSVPSRYINGCLAFEEGNYLGSVMLQEDSLHYEMLNCDVLKVLRTLETPSHIIAFHAEFFLNENNEFVFCEIASRVGGGMVPETISYAKGVDLLSESIRAQLPMEHQISIPRNDLAGWVTIPPQKGILRQIDIASFEWIKDSYFKEEDINKNFAGACSSADAIISYVVSGKDTAEIEGRIKVLYEWQIEHMVWEEEIVLVQQ